MSNRIDSFVDAFTGWLAEYEQKQQVSVMADQKPAPLTRPGNNQALGSQAQSQSVDFVRHATEQVSCGTPERGSAEQSLEPASKADIARQACNPAGIHLVDREISLGTHPQNCNCLECGIEQKFEEE